MPEKGRTVFAVVVFAPMPMFATFGVLTAVTIALVVLPSVLMLLTHEVAPTTEPSGVDERERLSVGASQ